MLMAWLSTAFRAERETDGGRKPLVRLIVAYMSGSHLAGDIGSAAGRLLQCAFGPFSHWPVRN